ncbi:MAG: DUF4159 domain-containing protein [Planctomycetota bacterium]|nr:DUF4159 domain-containing protein [Planctomycetota bacterium]
MILSILTVFVAVTSVPATAAFDNPKARIPPRAKPHRRSAGESLPPLPLPATPLRRSERKRQPAPPALIGMITFTGSHFVIKEGRRVPAEQFPTTQIDIERLTNYANHRLGIRYRYVATTLKNFSWDPVELPLLYITGWTPMPKLSDKAIEGLRRYIYDGGTLIVHAQCGRKEFTRTAKREIARLFPDRKLAALDTDSPLFRSYFRITTMRVRKDDEPFRSIPPDLEAVYVGCRPAIIFSSIDLNCGWDVDRHPIEGGILYHQDDALALGVNIITCSLANMKYARAFATEKVYHQQDQNTRDQLVIGQIVHDGDWDPTPHALPNLLKYITANTTLNVQFKRDEVNLADESAFDHVALYMTGLRDFKFNKTEIARLRTYLASGGVLVADAAAGKKAFDAAFRREIKRILPKAQLKPIALTSPLYQSPFKVSATDYTDAAHAAEPDLNAPAMLGIYVDGSLAVIYSPYSLSNGWEQIPYAYSIGYADDDALRLGVNIFAYAVTH